MSTQVSSINIQMESYDLTLVRDEKLVKSNRVKFKEGSKQNTVKFRLCPPSANVIKALAKYKLLAAVMVGKARGGKVYIVSLYRPLGEPTKLVTELYSAGTLLCRQESEVQNLAELLLDFAS